MKKSRSLVLISVLVFSASPTGVVAQITEPSSQSPTNRTPAATSTKSAKPQPPELNPEVIRLRQSFNEALSVIQQNYINGRKLDYNDLFKSSILGALRSLDPHSNFYDAKEFEELRAEWRSEYYGIGATIADRTVNGSANTYILATFPEAPALKAGLRFGDKILAVDGQSGQGKTSREVRDLLRGPRGSLVRITIERARDGQRQSIEVIRNAVPQPTVPDAYLIRPSVGYVAMTVGFNYTTAEEFKLALKQLHEQGITSLVIDLRNNTGGILDQALLVAEQFLQNGQLILTQSARRTKREFKSGNLDPDRIPLVILANRNTASAAEIVAGALQDHDRALIVGETTFGKGLVQSIIPLDSGTALTLTGSKYQTPSGRLVQRDYSKGFYDYFIEDGIGSERPLPKPSGPEFRTDMGRAIYSGYGITPDEAVKSRTLNLRQQRLVDPIFAFVRELVQGRIRGFENYQQQNEIDFHHNIPATDVPITDDLFDAFKKFATADPAQKLTNKQLDGEREFIARQLRYDMATAAYGITKASQVLVADDPQVLQAIQALPRAADFARARAR